VLSCVRCCQVKSEDRQCSPLHPDAYFSGISEEARHDESCVPQEGWSCQASLRGQEEEPQSPLAFHALPPQGLCGSGSCGECCIQLECGDDRSLHPTALRSRLSRSPWGRRYSTNEALSIGALLPQGLTEMKSELLCGLLAHCTRLGDSAPQLLEADQSSRPPESNGTSVW